MRISPEGVVTRFFTGLGRPQGLAIDRLGNVYVAASRKGHRGIIRITPDAEAELVVAGVGIVGLCFDDHRNLIAATTREIYRLPLGIEGYWPF
jgi:sugar lactone lactonase YvrE